VEGTEGRRLRTQLAEALANAGRSSEAGSAYLAIVEGADAEEALELRRRAALQLLMSDRVREGIEVLRAVLAAVGIGLVDGPRRKLLIMMIERARLRLRGLDFRERSADSIPGQELLRVDACETAFRGMCLVDTVRSTLFSARHLRLALDAGEPRRITMGLAVEAANTSLDGGRSRARAEQVLKKATGLAERLEQPFLLAYAALYGGIAAWAAGRWKEGLGSCDRAAQIVNDKQVLFAEEWPKLQHFTFDCLLMLGQMREISSRLPRFLLDARRRGDRFATSGMLVHSYAPHLMAGRPNDADQVIRQAEEEWTHHGLFMVNYWALYGRLETALYRGEGDRAWELIQEGWPALSRSSFFAFIETLLLLLVHARARAALAAAEAAPSGERFFGRRARLLRSAARDARRIERRRRPWSDPLAKLIRAGIAAQSRQAEQTLAMLEAAEEEFTAADMELYAAAARRRRGQFVGGEIGRELVVTADDWMTGQDIRDPARIAAMLAPGFRVSKSQV
jgi:eukaryotic-like serine/threonine-protein kinase